jgi:hypothetical protein
LHTMSKHLASDWAPCVMLSWEKHKTFKYFVTVILSKMTVTLRITHFFLPLWSSLVVNQTVVWVKPLWRTWYRTNLTQEYLTVFSQPTRLNENNHFFNFIWLTEVVLCKKRNLLILKLVQKLNEWGRQSFLSFMIFGRVYCTFFNSILFVLVQEFSLILKKCWKNEI